MADHWWEDDEPKPHPAKRDAWLLASLTVFVIVASQLLWWLAH